MLPLREGAPIASLVTAGLSTVAIRIPAHRAMQALIAASGCALAAPSANRSNGISPTRAEHVVASLGHAVPLVIDDGPCAAGLESTIVRGRDVLRPGPVTSADVLAALSSSAPRETRSQSLVHGAIVAPGQMATHYAPAKPLRLDALAPQPDEWMIGFGAISGEDTLSANGYLLEAAARLFDALHRADDAPKARIAVAPIPSEGIGEAINDRLARAATR